MKQNKNKFLLLKGTYEFSSKKRKYVFHLLDGDSITSKELKFIVDPTYDSTFKILFGSTGSEKRLKEMLNAILYPGIYPKKIKRLKFLPNEIHKLNEKNNKNSLITDIACEIEVDGKEYVIALEMQLGDKGSFNKRLFNYGTSLRNNNSFKNCIALGISISSRVQSNYTKLQKKTYTHELDLNYLRTIQVNLDNELGRMEEGKNIQINNKDIQDDGKEFIKLLSLRKWATKNDRNKYALPNWDISENPIINECIKILSEISDSELSRMILDEQYLEDIQAENFNAGMNKGYITCAFCNFLEDRNNKRALDLLTNNDIRIDEEEEVREILKDKENSDVEDFIHYLNNYNFFKLD